ncbi:putative serine threonine protein kinase [Rosellinia necatrix]|uniref:Putative serine threonine protein kinase n=1 Tax=Rosellinia necatrix TaxID=77044 RepID=A0A1W2TAM8_ROSNE|nr:putative serine threonine protein kinase [Rosellinia necatrix]
MDGKLEAERLKAIANHNSEFRYEPTIDDADGTGAWMGNNTCEELQGAVFALPLETTTMPKNHGAYILGSLDTEEAEQAAKSHQPRRAKDSSACDFELAMDNQTGVSRKAISIDLYLQPNADKGTRVRVGVLADRVMCAALEADPDAGWPTSRSVKKGSHFPVPQGGSLLITISWLQFRLWVPRLTPSQATLRRRLAYEFALETHRNPLTYLPNIHVSVDTRHDNMRVGTCKDKAIYLWMGAAGRPRSNPAKPFFTIWSPPGILLSAWQPMVDDDCPRTVAEVQVNKVEVYLQVSQLLPPHPNVYRCYDVGVYAADDSKSKPRNLPWAIGEHISENTQTLGSLFDLETMGKTTLTATQRLSIFQQICSAMSHSHSHNVAKGDFTSHDVFIVPAAAATGEEPPAEEKPDDKAVVVMQTDSEYTVKIFPFNMSPLTFCDRELAKAKQCDAIKLGRLGVRLLAGCDAHSIKPDFDDKAWIAASYGVDHRVQPLLEDLICGRFTSEHAMFWTTGIMVDKLALCALAKTMEQRTSKRKQIESRLAPAESSKRVRGGQAMLN